LIEEEQREAHYQHHLELAKMLVLGLRQASETDQVALDLGLGLTFNSRLPHLLAYLRVVAGR
jgi:hypothetical protein